MKRILALILTLALTLCFATGCGSDGNQEKAAEETAAAEAAALEGKSLMIYCGAGMKEPFQEIADTFKAETGCEIALTFGNAGQIQTQINTSKEGDMFIAGSAEELKPVKDSVENSVDLVKHIPVIAVQKGNPKEINTIKDLANGAEVLIGDPEATPIGKIAKKIFKNEGIADKVKIAATTTTAPQMATSLAAGEADAAIVWKENVKDDKVEIADIEEMNKYIKTIPAASLTTTKDAETLKAFEDFLQTEKAQDIWTKYGYELVETDEK